MTARSNRDEQLVVKAAAKLVEDGMLVGIGTGTTISQLLPRPRPSLHRHLTCNRKAALKLGLSVQPFLEPPTTATWRSTAPGKSRQRFG